jgi:hypothetical protein
MVLHAIPHVKRMRQAYADSTICLSQWYIWIFDHTMSETSPFIVISLLREDPLSPGILDMFFLKYLYHSSLCKTEFTYSKFHQIINSTTQSNELNWGRQVESILSLEFGSILLCLLCQSMSRGVPNRRSFLFFYRDKWAIFKYLAFLNRWVSLKEREFTYSKFQQIINSSTHRILCMGGSSIP